jgi:hypothetical protein
MEWLYLDSSFKIKYCYIYCIDDATGHDTCWESFCVIIPQNRAHHSMFVPCFVNIISLFAEKNVENVTVGGRLVLHHEDGKKTIYSVMVRGSRG